MNTASTNTPDLKALLATIPVLDPNLPDGYTHKRDYQSYSAIDTYCRCPAAYKRRYIDPKIMDVPPIIPDPLSPAELGTLVHRGMELSVQVLWSRKHKGRVTKQAAHFYDKLNDAFAELPNAAAQLLVEAQEMLKAYLPHESVYYDQIRGLEWPFELVLEDSKGDIVIKGFIDRLEMLPDGIVKILDYKTSRLLFTKDELRQSLQASIYEMAVRDSQALNVDPDMPIDTEFIMLRHPGIRQRTTRTPEQLNRAFTLVVGIVRKIESQRSFPPQLNKYCAYCDHKLACPLWRQLLLQGMPETHVDPNDLTAIATEYERLNNAAKCLYRRKEEMGDLMKIHLIGHDSIETSEHIYRMSKTVDTEFLDPHLVASLFAKAYNRTVPEVIRQITRVSKTEFDVLMKAIEGRLPLAAQKELREAMDQLIVTKPNPKLQPYKKSTASGKAAQKIPRQAARRKMRV